MALTKKRISTSEKSRNICVRFFWVKNRIKACEVAIEYLRVVFTGIFKREQITVSFHVDDVFITYKNELGVDWIVHQLLNDMSTTTSRSRGASSKALLAKRMI